MVVAEKAADKPSKYRGLKPPWKKGDKSIPKSPGRPKSIDFAKAFREFASQGQRADQLFQRLLKKKPETAMAHLAGKPVETQVQLTAESSVEAIAVALARLRKQGSDKVADA